MRFLSPKTGDGGNYKLLAILDGNEWEAVTVKVASPLHQAVRKEQGPVPDPLKEVRVKDSSKYGRLTLTFMVTSPFRSVIELAAYEGFYDLSFAYLQQLAVVTLRAS